MLAFFPLSPHQITPFKHLFSRFKSTLDEIGILAPYGRIFLSGASLRKMKIGGSK